MTTYQLYRSLGICARCCRVSCTTAYCDACRAERTRRRKLRYPELRAAAICPQCYRKHDGTRAHCPVCRQKQKEKRCLAA